MRIRDGKNFGFGIRDGKKVGSTSGIRNTGFITVLCGQDLGLDLSDSEDERRDIDIDSEGEDSRLSAGEDSRS